MIPSPTPITFVLIILGVSTFIFIMLLPALLELKKPKDAGPRMIMGQTFFRQPEIRNVLIVNIEEEQGFDQMLVEKIANVMVVLPNLEV